MSFADQIPITIAPINQVETWNNYPTEGGSPGWAGGQLLPFLNCAGAIALNLIVETNPIYYQLGLQRGEIYWLPERYLPPCIASLRRRFDVVRCRSGIAGAHAVVSIEALLPTDIFGPAALDPNGQSGSGDPQQGQGQQADLPRFFVWK